MQLSSVCMCIGYLFNSLCWGIDKLLPVVDLISCEEPNEILFQFGLLLLEQ